MTYNSNISSKKPFEPAADYTKVHNAMFRLYTRLPDFKADHAQLYTFLMSQYNTDYGYAFPDTYDIAMALNCGERTVTGVKQVLVKYGLIEIQRHPTFGNDVYFVKAPITDEVAFYAKHPEAREYYEARQQAYETRRRSGLERKRAFEERVRAQKVTQAVPETTTNTAVDPSAIVW